METAITMEDLLEQMRKAGWRMSNLSHVNGRDAYSCIVERDTPARDGYGVFASSSLVDNPRDALAEAWTRAQTKVGELDKIPPSHIQAQVASVEKSPQAARLIGALSRWIDALDPEEDF